MYAVCVHLAQIDYKKMFPTYVKYDGMRVIGRAKRAPHCGVQSRFRYVDMYVCRVQKCVGGITWPNARMLKVSIEQWNPTSDTRVIHLDYTLEQL